MQTLNDVTVGQHGNVRIRHAHGWYEPPLIAVYLPLSFSVHPGATYDIQASGWFLRLDAKCVGRLTLDRHVFLFNERGLDGGDDDALSKIHDEVHWKNAEHGMLW